MPGFDATGPRGGGPMTGWGRGPCGSGWKRSPAMGRGRGFGGRGFGVAARGRGGPGWWDGSFFGGQSPVDDTGQNEVDALRNELAAAREEISALQRRINEIKREDG